MTEPQAPDATVEALARAIETAKRDMVAANRAWVEGRELPSEYRAEWGAGYAAAILAAMPDYRLVPAEEWERMERIESAAEELAHFEEGGGFRANHPEDLFTALRAALAHPAEAEEKPDAV